MPVHVDPEIEEDPSSGDQGVHDLVADTGRSADDVAGASTNDDLVAAPASDDFPPRRWTTYAVALAAPVLALLLAAAAAVLKYEEGVLRGDVAAGAAATQAAKDSTVALLSYQPGDVADELGAAGRDRLTGDFQNAYKQLIDDVVVPGAKEKRISAVATVPAVSLVSVHGDRAVVLAFVNQTTIIGNGAPTSTASTVRLTMTMVNDRWLVSEFEPV